MRKEIRLAFAAGAWLLASSGALAQAELKVAIDATYEPFTYKTPDGKPTGFDVDRKSTRLNSSHVRTSRMPSSA